MKKLFLLALLSCLAACASVPKQTETLLAAKTFPVSSKHVIEDVPFIKQSAGHCGPAALTMALNFSGNKSAVDEVASQVYTPGMNGSLQTDMISASRRQGMMAIPITGLEALLKEVEAGNPVIVFENLSVSWFPQWHYAVVFGYDLEKQEVMMHSGPEEFKHWDLRKFERSWMLGDYWGLVVFPPEKVSATASEASHISAAAALEQIGKWAEAETAYYRILKQWPKSLGAFIGLANIAYSEKEYSKAEMYLEQALKAHPEAAVAWHNLAFAQSASGDNKKARESAIEALKRVSPENKATYSENLKAWIH